MPSAAVGDDEATEIQAKSVVKGNAAAEALRGSCLRRNDGGCWV